MEIRPPFRRRHATNIESVKGNSTDLCEILGIVGSDFMGFAALGKELMKESLTDKAGPAENTNRKGRH
jgi:hypothetical protein